MDTKSLSMTASLNPTANNTQDSWRMCQQCLWGRGGKGKVWRCVEVVKDSLLQHRLKQLQSSY